MNQYKVLSGIILLILLCACSRPDRKRDRMTETGPRPETVLSSPDECMENSEESDRAPEETSGLGEERLFAEYDQELARFLKKPEIIVECRKENPSLGGAAISLADLTGDGIPEVLVSLMEGSIGMEMMTGRTVMYDLRTGKALFNFCLASPAFHGDTLQSYVDRKGKIHYLAVSYMVRDGEDYVEDIAVQDITRENGVFQRRCPFAFRLRGESMPGGETAKNDSERFGFYNKSFVFRDLTEKQLELFLPDDQSRLKSTEELSKLLQMASPYEYMEYLFPLGKETKRETFLKVAGNEKILKLLEKHDMDSKGMDTFVRRAGKTCFLPPDIRQAGVIADGVIKR